MTQVALQLSDGRRIELDEKGYMREPEHWDRDIAVQMATNDGMNLSEDHFTVLEIFRAYFEEFEIEPPMRALVKLASEHLGEEKANSRYLYKLFPEGPTTQACRYAGLPRPLSCI